MKYFRKNQREFSSGIRASDSERVLLRHLVSEASSILYFIPNFSETDGGAFDLGRLKGSEVIRKKGTFFVVHL